MKRLKLIWMIPILALIFGASILLWAGLEQQRVDKELEKTLEEHVESVSRLIWEGTKEATAALDLVYELSEENLKNTVELLDGLGDWSRESLAIAENTGLVVWIHEADPKNFTGLWGVVDEEFRSSVVEEVFVAAPGEIVESGGLSTLGLYCAHFVLESGRTIACKRARDLSSLRREVGLGPLLKNVLSQSVVYAVIQDEVGVLAGATDIELSTWNEDPLLDLARKGHEHGLSFRTRVDRAGTMFEGVGPFPLPDGTTAVLRVGVNAAHIVAVREGLGRRYQLLFGVVGLLVLLVSIGTWLLSRWDSRRIEAETLLAERDQKNRHWQSIGQMAATVAHEVRNPLNTLKMIAQRLGREFEVPERDRQEYADLLQLLLAEADRVNSVVTEFLELGRPLVLELKKAPVVEVLNEALLASLLRAEQEGKTLVSEIDSEGDFELDRKRFGQIINNLLGNALDAVGKEGTVHVFVSMENAGEDLHVVIEDDGPGMDPEALQKALDPFVTTKPKGTGLGLPLAKRLTEAHRGKMFLSSPPSGGTRVELFFPTSAGKL